MIEVVPPATCAVGVYTVQPHFCGPMLWLNANPGWKDLIKKGTELGCDFTVEVGVKEFKVIVSDTKEGVSKVKQTYRALNTPAGMEWLMRYLSGY